MKHLRLTIIMLTLLLSQWGAIDHAFHEHVAGEVCDYCVTAKSFDSAVTSTAQTFVSFKQKQVPVALLQVAQSTTNPHYYSVRAPPRSV